MPDNKLEYILSIKPDTGQVNVELANVGAKIDRMSEKASAFVGRSPENVARVMASLSPEGQRNYASSLATYAESALRSKHQELSRDRAYFESQDRKKAQAERSKFMGGVGRAAAGALIGEEMGLSGIGAMIAGGVGPAAIVTAGVEIIRKPFELMASLATKNAKALQELNTPLGTAAMGFANKQFWLGKIPFVGGALREKSEAEQKEMETRLGFARLVQPGMAQQLDFAQENRRAAAGLRMARQLPDMIRAEELANRTDTAMDRIDQLVDQAQKRGDEFGMSVFNPATVQGKANARELEILRTIAAETQKPGGIDKAKEADLLRQYKETTGHALGGPTIAARPAQIMGIEDMMTQLYEQAASMGPHGGPMTDEQRAREENTRQLEELNETMRQAFGGGLGEAMRRALMGNGQGDGGNLGGFNNL